MESIKRDGMTYKNHHQTIFITLFLLFFVTINVFAIIPDTTYIRKPEWLGLMYKDLNVVTVDNYKIATWFFPAQDTISDAEYELLNGEKREYKPLFDKPRPTIIICNGDAGNMSYFQLSIAYALTKRGFNVVTFDWRGFGDSTPFKMDRNYLCYTEMLEDYHAVINEVVKQPEVKNEAVSVMGWSTGAYLSMITAYNNQNVSAFIGRSLCTDFEDFIPLVMQVKGKTRDQLIVPDDFPRELMPAKIASKFTKPIFLINGENDLRTPTWMSEKIIGLLPDTTHRELMIVKNAAHGGKEDPIMIAFDEFIVRVTDFLTDTE
ncbi:MAG: alpha/beta fold hydrolase [Bacteroidales bacterium]|nr:alpha/beta fold hydrolase [Bacteroidales bacterium]